MTSVSSRRPLDEERAYLLDMIRQLARLARTAGEVETEILLHAILDITKANARQRVAAAAQAKPQG